MTDEQINAAIARALNADEHWMVQKDYCTDLNAMHEAEAVLKVVDTHEYTNLLYDLACKMQEQTGKWMPYSMPARQRAEAFLQTLDKWEEVQG